MGGRTVAQAVVARPGLFRCAILEDPPWWEEPPAATRSAVDYSSMSGEEIAAAGRQQNPGWHEDEFAAWAESKRQFRPSPDWLSG